MSAVKLGANNEKKIKTFKLMKNISLRIIKKQKKLKKLKQKNILVHLD